MEQRWKRKVSVNLWCQCALVLWFHLPLKWSMEITPCGMHESQQWMKKDPVWCGIPNAEFSHRLAQPQCFCCACFSQRHTRMRPHTVYATSTHFTFNCNQFRKLDSIKVLTMKNVCTEKDVISNLMDNNRLQMKSGFSLHFPARWNESALTPNACVPHSSAQSRTVLSRCVVFAQKASILVLHSTTTTTTTAGHLFQSNKRWLQHLFFLSHFLPNAYVCSGKLFILVHNKKKNFCQHFLS